MNNIIANELDIVLPNIEISEIVEVCHITNREYIEKYNHLEKNWELREGVVYPWIRRILKLGGKHMFNVNNYPKFEYIFEMAETLIENPNIALIYQKTQPNRDFGFHFDSQSFGYRFCYGLDTTQPFVEFSKIKDEHITSRSYFREDMFEEFNCEFIPKRKNTVIGLAGLRFPHRVPFTNAIERYVFLAEGNPKMHNYNKLQELVYE